MTRNGTVIEARYPNVCEECDQKITPGDPIFYSLEHSSFIHADHGAPTSKVNSDKPCPKCFLIHAGDCF